MFNEGVFFLILPSTIYLTSVVINAFSCGEANIFMLTCWLPAKISHSPIPQETSLLCSASEIHKSSFNTLMDVVDCLSNICNAQLEMIGLPNGLLTKSSMS